MYAGADKKLNQVQKDKIIINKNDITELKETLTLLTKTVGFDIDKFKRKCGYK
jgi:hypothetical protein